MDKEIDNERLKKLNPIPLRLSKQTMPNGTVYYRGNVKALKTVDIQEIARRIVEDRSEIRESTFIHTYGLIKEQIYEALARGENVDLGFGQLSIRVKGQFESASDSFDPERIVFTPSARTRQLEQHLRAYKQTEPTRRHPVLTEVCTYDSIGNRDAAFNTVRSDNPYIHLIGFNIKVMGDHPDCKLRFRSADGEIVVEPAVLVLNERNHLLAGLRTPLTPGEWTAELGTQFQFSYHLYKEPRYTSRDFTVTDSDPYTIQDVHHPDSV